MTRSPYAQGCLEVLVHLLEVDSRLPKGSGAAWPQGQRQVGAGEGAVAGSLMALEKKKHKTGELWGDINRAVRH